jgi:thiamine biosynthesis lipoprotein
MGTYYRVTLPILPEGMQEGALQASVESQLERIDALMSTYRDDSEISRFNRSRETTWFPVSIDTATVVTAALDVFAESHGAFDITVAPLVDLWGFGPGNGEAKIPGKRQIQDLLETIGSRHLEVRLTPPALRKHREALQIDLSGIAKGFAVDSLATELENLGLRNYLVDIGGEMRAAGHKANQTPWNIAIERPTVNQRGIQTTLPLRDIAIATSGDYRNCFDVDGQRYSHEIDPRNGRPIRHQLVSVTVLDPSCMRADAWATALIVLGPDQGKALAERSGLPVFLIVNADPGFEEIESSAFAALPHSP